MRPPFDKDCNHFVRTGTCKYGLNCRYNHPVARANLVDQGREIEKGSEDTSQIACKFYLTAGGCKNGESCRFSHSKAESEIAVAEFNVLGLPIRLGEKKCPFYMRNGSCGYGTCCRFHHPDPTTGGGSELYCLTLDGESMGYFIDASEMIDNEPLLPYFSRPSSAQTSRTSALFTNESVPYLENDSSYMPAPDLHPEGLHQSLEWCAYQVPIFYQQRRPMPSVPVVNVRMDEDLSQRVEELPQRPGQAVCQNLLHTGDCLYGSACWFDHPKGLGPEREPCVLNNMGLPIRPGKPLCWDYENLGICKYGYLCAFNHPVVQAPSVAQTGSTSESPSGSNTANPWDE